MTFLLNPYRFKAPAPPAAIGPQFIAATAAQGRSCPLPEHGATDLLLLFLYRSDTAAQPSPPAGWTGINGGFGNSNGQRLLYKIATGGDLNPDGSPGVLTTADATAIAILAYRGVDQANPIGANAQFTNLADIRYPALTLQRTDGTSRVVAIHGRRSGNVNQPSPPGTTKRADTHGGVASAASRVEAFGSGLVSSWPELFTGGDNGQRYRSVSVELRAAQ